MHFNTKCIIMTTKIMIKKKRTRAGIRKQKRGRARDMKTKKEDDMNHSYRPPENKFNECWSFSML